MKSSSRNVRKPHFELTISHQSLCLALEQRSFLCNRNRRCRSHRSRALKIGPSRKVKEPTREPDAWDTHHLGELVT